MVVGEASTRNIIGGMESTGGVRLHNHKRKLKQRFDIIKKLGQGTYGKVQLGINKETGQEVAIKTIKKCKIETEADLIRIRREIQIMSSVQHPNIIHIYEVFENKEKIVLVMEYAAGGDLFDYILKRGILPEHEARLLFRQIATAVYYCHKHKICHRDLKLENILLDQNCNAKIADFGLSNIFDERRLLKTFCGSPLYASPEIVRGIPYCGPEVDCWCLGVLLYALVYSAMPFDGSNFKRLVKQITQPDYYEDEKNKSRASGLIKELLNTSPTDRADIKQVCSHWWVNEGFDDNCLEVAENLASQTPIRLDLLLALVPESASAENLVVGDQPCVVEEEENIALSKSQETLVPTRCHSEGSFMDIDVQGDKGRNAVSGEAKRKLETTPSMDDTGKSGWNKRKDASRHSSHLLSPKSTRKPHKNEYEEEMEYTVSSPTEESPPHFQSKDIVEKSPSKDRSNTPDVSSIPKVEPSDAPPGDAQSTIQSDDVPKQLVKVASKTNESSEMETGAPCDKDGAASPKERQRAKSNSLDSEVPPELPKNSERRRSKIFETAEKFNQMASGVEAEKPKKIFIPGVNVGGAKRAFERKASLTTPTVAPQSPVSPKSAAPPSKVIIDVPQDKSKEAESKENKCVIKEEDKKRAVDIITGALGKNGGLPRTPPVSPSGGESKKLGLKIQVGPNDVRNATVSVSTPVDNKFAFENKQDLQAKAVSSIEPTQPSSEEQTKSSKMEITLKSATLPRPRKTSRAEITLAGVKAPETAFKSEVEAKVGYYPRKLRTQKSEIAFPVAAVVPPMNRSTSLEPEANQSNVSSPVSSGSSKERIIPIQVEADNQRSQSKMAGAPLPPKPPTSQRSMSQRSSSLSRQSTAESDTDSALGSTTIGPEPIRKSPREYIIPIAVEGGGYVTPRSGSVEPDSKNSTPTSAGVPRFFGKPRRMSSLLSDASEDDFPTLHRHMHRLRSSRPFRQMSEHADSLSSGEDDDDDGFELLTAENLFSTLLSRVRSLTQRLNVDDGKGSGFPNSRLLNRMASNPQSFAGGLHDQPLSRRISESQFRRSMSRDKDSVFSSRDFRRSEMPNSRESVFETPSSSSSSSNNSPRDKVNQDEAKSEELRKEAQESLEQNFTPSLARRLSRQFIEQTRQSLPRSPSATRDKYRINDTDYRYPGSVLDQLEKKRSALNRNIRRANSLLDSRDRYSLDRGTHRSISLFEDTERHDDDATYNDDDTSASLPPLPKLLVNLNRKKRDKPFQNEKIQEEPNDDSMSLSLSTTRATSELNSTTSCDTSPNESSSTITDQRSREFENRLLAAENLIKESKLKNLGISKGNYNSYDRDSLSAISDAASATIAKRRNCLPNLRTRSSSLSRDPCPSGKSFGGSQEGLHLRSLSPERSLLSKFFRGNKEAEKPPKPKTQRRISRFLRPDFFDTPREESQYVKEQEAQKAAENERRKSRFTKKKAEEIPQKELKNEANLAAKSTIDNKDEKPATKPSFLQSLEKKLDKFRSSDEKVEVPQESEVQVKEEVEQPRVNDAPVQNSSSKSKVSSVLGIFRNNEETKSQSNILSKFKKSTAYKGSRSDGVLTGESPSTSKIPTKLVKNDSKLGTVKEVKKPVEKDNKTSPPRRISPENAKGSKLPKKQSPDKVIKKESSAVKVTENKKSPEKALVKKKKSDSPSQVLTEKMDNKQTEKDKEKEKPKTSVLKKKVNSTAPKIEGDEKKEGNEDGAKKKKKIVRVVKKVVKKTANGSEDKANGTDKLSPTTKPVSRASSVKREVVPETITNAPVKIKRKSPETQNSAKRSESMKESATKPPSAVTNCQPKKNRSNLKLDFSKIPQHSSFRNNGTMRKEINKTDSSKEEVGEKMAENNGAHSEEKVKASLSKMTHKASILGHEIVIDKPLMAQDVEALKNKVEVEKVQDMGEVIRGEEVEADEGVKQEGISPDVTLKEMPQSTSGVLVPAKDAPSDRSTAEDVESLDSWSICSTDVFGSRAPSELHSPTSPTYSLYLRGDTQESIIDRIRRKSFYSRFNDRKRKTPLTATPSGISMTSSLTLPRKFSFGSSRSSAGSLTNRRNPEKCYSLYGEDIPSCRKSPVEKDRYSDGSISSYSDLKSPTLLDSGLVSPSSTHDPLLKYPQSFRKYSSLDDSSLLSPYSGSRANCTLPRKYKYSTSNLEPRTVKYFEDLLSPSQDGYSSRCSPIDYGQKNGYHNGNSDGRDEGKGEDKRHFRNNASMDYFESLPTPSDHRNASSIE